MRTLRLVGLLVVTFAAGLGLAGAVAQDAPSSGTPVAGAMTTMTLVEHATFVTSVDVGENGMTPGDLLVWGPDPLFDETNTTDTGATTQGSCLALNTDGVHHCTETVIFADGSTIEIQGVQPPGSTQSSRTIVGGSGQYLHAAGTVQIDPSEDQTVWTKTFEIVLP